MRTVREVLAEQGGAGKSIWAAIEAVKAQASHDAAQHALAVVKRSGIALTGGQVDGFGAYDNDHGVGGQFSLRFDGPVYFSVDWRMDGRQTTVEVHRDGARLVDQWERTYTLKTGMATAEAIGAFVAKAMDDHDREQG